MACGNQTGTEIGTIGCLVLLQNGNLCLLSNNHVLANATGDLGASRAQIGDPVYQPGNTVGSFIAKLDDYVPYSSSRPNYADAAVALTTLDAVNPEVGTSSAGGPLYVINPTPMDPADVYNGGLSVMKFGARTGPSIGRIMAMVQNVPMTYDGYGTVYFDDVLVITTPGGGLFSAGGFRVADRRIQFETTGRLAHGRSPGQSDHLREYDRARDGRAEHQQDHLVARRPQFLNAVRDRPPNATTIRGLGSPDGRRVCRSIVGEARPHH